MGDAEIRNEGSQQHRGAAKSGGAHPSLGPSPSFWVRRGEMEPMLERLQQCRGSQALWDFAIACISPIKALQEILPDVITEASSGFSDPSRRGQLRSSFGGSAVGAFMIGMKNHLPGAAVFLAGYRLLDDDPIVAVTDSCRYVRAAYTFRRRLREIGVIDGCNHPLDHVPVFGGDSPLPEQGLLGRCGCEVSVDERKRQSRKSQAGVPPELDAKAWALAAETEALVWSRQVALLESMIVAQPEV